MRIFKNEFGWSASAHNKQKNIKYYVDVQFPEGAEPMGDYADADLVLRFPNGEEKECFLSSYQRKDGSSHPKIVVLKNKQPLHRNELNEQTTLTGNGRDMVGHMDQNTVRMADLIKDDDLPF